MPPINIGSTPVTALRVGAQIVSAVYIGSALAYQAGDRYDYYVDSVSGSDVNDGSVGAPLKTISAASALLTSGKSVGLKRGGYWREQLGSLTESRANIIVGAYGVGIMPVLDGADPIATGAWSKTAGQTNVYQATTSYPASSTGEFISLWEDGTRLRWVASIALCDATAGTYYIATTSGTGTGTLYVNATGSGNPASNGKLYEVTTRAAGIQNGSGANWLIQGIHTRRSMSNNGSLIASGVGAIVRNCIAEDGTKHNLYISQNGLAEDCIAWKADWPDRVNATMFVAYTALGAGYSAVFRRCVAIFSQAQAAASVALGKDCTGFYSHTGGDASRWDSLTYEDCSARYCVTAFGVANATSYIVTRPYSEGCSTDHLSNALTATITDPYCKELAGVVNSVAYNHGAGTTTIDGLRHITTSASNKGSVFNGISGSAVTLTKSVIVRAAGSTGYRYTANGNVAGSIVNMDHTIIYGDANTAAYRIAGTGTPDYNVYHPATADYYIGASTYVSWSAYRAGQPTIDVNSVQADPLLIDPVAGNFGVNTGSPAIALGAGLTRPNIAYTPIPSDAAVAAM